MLLSRNIIPPVLDFNEYDSALWDTFTDGRKERFEEAKLLILDKTIKTNQQLKKLQQLFLILDMLVKIVKLNLDSQLLQS